MKKFLILFIILFGSMNTFALEGKWEFTKNIRIYIPPNQKYTIMMQHAFDRWSRVTKEKIIFRNVSTPKAAQIKVEFVDKIDTMNKKEFDKAIGLTRTETIHNEKLIGATIYIAYNTQDGKSLNRDEIFTTMLHEIGHAIGLNHSDVKNSVMYPGVNVIQEIQNSDLDVLYNLYHWK